MPARTKISPYRSGEPRFGRQSHGIDTTVRTYRLTPEQLERYRNGEAIDDILKGEETEVAKKIDLIKREREKISSPFHPDVMAAWNRGFEAGAKRQNELDTQLLLEWLGQLEDIPGIGSKTATKIREHWLCFVNRAKDQ